MFSEGYLKRAKNAFIENRQILDATLVANEAIDSIMKGNGSAVLCKLDLEKVYDHVDWSFLCSILTKIGFLGSVDKMDYVVYLLDKLFL